MRTHLLGNLRLYFETSFLKRKQRKVRTHLLSNEYILQQTNCVPDRYAVLYDGETSIHHLPGLGFSSTGLVSEPSEKGKGKRSINIYLNI